MQAYFSWHTRQMCGAGDTEVMHSGAYVANTADRQDNHGLVVHAIARVVDTVRTAYRVLGDLEACMTPRFSGVEEFEVERTQELSEILESLGRQIPVLLDLMGMDATRDAFLSSWKAFEENLAQTNIRHPDTEGLLISPPLELVNDIVTVLGAGSRGVLRRDPPEVATLEYILRSTPQILARREIVPTKEVHVQRALHDHLEFTFPDYNKNVKLPKGLKSFEPDGAIPSIEALIEVKFVDAERKVGPIFSGIMEDLSGYGGSKDWSRFYSVSYQTEPFVNEVRFDKSVRLSGSAGSWKPIVVTGPGGRGRQKYGPRGRKRKGRSA